MMEGGITPDASGGKPPFPTCEHAGLERLFY
jgi:hypothetical protein